MKLSVVILAAGEGTRLNSRKPKVLHDIGGRPMIEYVLETARSLKPDAIHIVIGAGAEAVRTAVNDNTSHRHEQNERCGTAHAVSCAKSALDSGNHVLVLYGDVPLIKSATLKNLLATLDKVDYAVLTETLINPTGYGRIVRDDAGQVTRVVEQRDATPDEAAITEVNTGIIAVREGCLRPLLERVGKDNAQGEYYLTDCVGLAVESGLKVTTCMIDNEIEGRGINTPEELEQAERALQQQRARQLMAQGVVVRDASRIDIRGEISAGQDVIIDVNTVFEGRVELGAGVRIEPNCILRDVSIGSGTIVKAFSVLESSRTGKNCTIGPFARIRPEVDLADSVGIGNFVELKKSTVGSNTKINHLSYVGDSEVGRDVNVGAGTVTCNYDGAQKHRTIIGDDVFVGSGTQLIAPVKVGDGATIGAGSTITRDAESGVLSLSRSEQKTMQSWRRPRKPAGKGKK